MWVRIEIPFDAISKDIQFHLREQILVTNCSRLFPILSPPMYQLSAALSDSNA